MTRSSVDEIVEALALEIDGTQIDERLRLTPTERLESMQRVLAFVAAARQPRGTGPAGAD